LQYQIQPIILSFNVFANQIKKLMANQLLRQIHSAIA
jgi:hypothetical protein